MSAVESIDWERLLDLRDSFLEGSAGQRDYWEDESLLRDYDATFGRRIAWKWEWVLTDLQRRGWSPPEGVVLDWGCGSGVAAREIASAWRVAGVAFYDRSPRAMRFAELAFREAHADIPVTRDAVPATLAISHALSELTDDALLGLVRRARGAQAVLWVEPGTYELSRRLIAVREQLLADGFHAVAPCTHGAPCGMLAAENQRHWCHHFAAPPPEVFTDGFWANFGRIMGVDLRSLPVSYLVLDRRPVAPLPPEAVRIIGRPRIYKPYALLLGCDRKGVRERQLTKRGLPEVFKQLKKGRAFLPVQRWDAGSGEIAVLEDLDTNPS